jgi:hypothetical protein
MRASPRGAAGSTVDVNAEPWIPVRFIHQPQTCHLCWVRIPRGAPGSRTGERGTRAWMLRGARMLNIAGQVLLGPDLWECLACHDEGTRAELAGEAVHSAA